MAINLASLAKQDQHQGLTLLMLSWDRNWDSHSPMNGYPSFYPRIALVAPSPEICGNWGPSINRLHNSFFHILIYTETRDSVSDKTTPFTAHLDMFVYNPDCINITDDKFKILDRKHLHLEQLSF